MTLSRRQNASYFPSSHFHSPGPLSVISTKLCASAESTASPVMIYILHLWRDVKSRCSFRRPVDAEPGAFRTPSSSSVAHSFRRFAFSNECMPLRGVHCGSCNVIYEIFTPDPDFIPSTPALPEVAIIRLCIGVAEINRNCLFDSSCLDSLVLPRVCTLAFHFLRCDEISSRKLEICSVQYGGKYVFESEVSFVTMQ